MRRSLAHLVLNHLRLSQLLLQRFYLPLQPARVRGRRALRRHRRRRCRRCRRCRRLGLRGLLRRGRRRCLCRLHLRPLRFHRLLRRRQLLRRRCTLAALSLQLRFKRCHTLSSRLHRRRTRLALGCRRLALGRRRRRRRPLLLDRRCHWCRRRCVRRSIRLLELAVLSLPVRRSLAHLLRGRLRLAQLLRQRHHLCRLAAGCWRLARRPATCLQACRLAFSLSREPRAQQRQHLGLVRGSRPRARCRLLAPPCYERSDASFVQDTPPVRLRLHLDQLARRPPRLHPLALGGLDRGEQGPLRLSHCLRLALLGAELLTQQLFLDDDRLLHRAFRATAGLGGQLARQLLGKSCLDLHLQLQPPRLRLALPLGSDGGGEPPGERLVARERVPQALGFIVVDGQLEGEGEGEGEGE
eukprot:scaffold76252_cov57-Phaeocystis_antarctica.AAC.6